MISYESQLMTPIGRLAIQASQTAITAVKFCESSQYPLENALTKEAKTQLNDYFNQRRQSFDLPLAPQGSDFQKSVWQALLGVPFGHTDSYLSIASAIGNKKACRAVGAANAKNPIAIIIPCHRIVGANGALTGYAGGLERKSFLLKLEHAS